MAHGQGTVKPVVNIGDAGAFPFEEGEAFPVNIAPLGERIGAEKRGCMPHIAPLGKSAFPLRVHRTDG